MARAWFIRFVTTFVLGIALAGTAFAHPRWRCGDGETFEVIIDEFDNELSPGYLLPVVTDKDENAARVDLLCAMQGHGLGTEWLCSAENRKCNVVVEVRRGRRTNDPWALAAVRSGDETVAEDLPCTVEHVSDVEGSAFQEP